MMALWQDIRYGLRMLAKNPGFTAVAVVSLAVGVGVNAALFSMLGAVLLRELPVPAPQELRVLNWVGPHPRKYLYAAESLVITRDRWRHAGFSYPMYEVFRERGSEFSEMFAFAETDPLTLVARGRGYRTTALMVSGSFFDGYGAGTMIGRTMAPSDDQPVAVITYRAWERYFASDPDVIGRTIALNVNVFTVIGVLPRNYAGPLMGDAPDVYIPLSFQPRFLSDFTLESPDVYWLHVMLRLKPGATTEQARALLEVPWHQHMDDRWGEESKAKGGTPELLVLDGRHGPMIDRERQGGVVRDWMWVSGLLLLIACVNLAGLMLARNAAREHEMAVRAVLGAGRWRLARQSLVEGLCLATAGGVLGVLCAWWAEGLLPSLNPDSLYFAIPDNTRLNVRIDPVVLAFTFGCVLATALLIGLVPGLVDARIDPGRRLQSTRVRGASRMRLGKALVVVQIALSVVLVTSTGLMVHGLVKQYRLDLGFNPKNLLVCHLNAAQAGYEEPGRTRLYEQVDQVLARLPGVRSAAFADQCHIGAGWDFCYVPIPDRSADNLLVPCMAVSDSFLETLQIPLLLGRGFNALDRPGSVYAAVVNQSFCRQVLGGENPIGRMFRANDRDCQVIGVCADARYNSFASRQGMRPVMYFSYRQRPVPEMWFALRTAVPPRSLTPTVRKAVAEIDPQIPLTITTQAELCDASIFSWRRQTMLGMGLGILALALSSVGVYGLMAHHVSQRTGEIGTRIALGARPRAIACTVLREALFLAALGVGIGMPLGLMTVRVVRWVRYCGISPWDPMTLGVTLAVLTAVVLLAAWLPARRAARVDPMVALRYE